MKDQKGDASACSDDVQSLLKSHEMEATLRTALKQRLEEGWFSNDGYHMLREAYELSRTEILVFLVKYGGLVKPGATDVSIELIGKKLGMRGNTVRTHITRILNKLDYPGCKDISCIRKWAVEKQILHDEKYPVSSQCI